MDWKAAAQFTAAKNAVGKLAAKRQAAYDAMGVIRESHDEAATVEAQLGTLESNAERRRTARTRHPTLERHHRL